MAQGLMSERRQGTYAHTMDAVAQPRERRAASYRLRLALAIVLGLLVAGLGTSVAVLLPEEYTATSIMALRPRIDADISAEDVKLIAQEYAVFVDAAGSDPATLRALGVDAVEDIKIKVAVDTGTANVRVEAEHPDGADAVRTANGLVDRGLTRAVDDELVSGSLIAPARPSTTEGRPRALYAGASIAAGVMLTAGLAYVWRKKKDD